MYPNAHHQHHHNHFQHDYHRRYDVPSKECASLEAVESHCIVFKAKITVIKLLDIDGNKAI